MDRRGHPETAEQQDEYLQRALDAILVSYNGGAPEILYGDAIACFEALIEISQNTDRIKEFARRKGIDLKYLVDGANFVISRMHFNAENNYYVTLGLPRNAHHDEIRERWKRLMFLYHPDRQSGNEDWVMERAKKVNEAYSVLKDEQKRSAFDRQLIEAAARQEGFQRPDHLHASEKARVMHIRPRSGSSEGPLASIRKYFTKMLIAFYLFCMLGVLALIYSQDRAPDLESQLRADESASALRTTGEPETGTSSKNVQLPSAGERREGSFFDNLDHPVQAGPAVGPQGPVQGEKGAVSGSRNHDAVPRVSRDNRKPEEVRRTVLLPEKDASVPEADRREPGKHTADRSPLVLLKPLLSQSAVTPKKGMDGAMPSEQKKEMTARWEKSQDEKIPARAEKSEVKPVREARAGAGGRPDGVTQDEVSDFMKRFLAAYEKGDLDLMMSLFSQSAVENNRLRYHEIKNAYRLAFDGKVNYYKLRDMHIRVDGPAAYVTASYSIDRYSSADDRWLKFNGRISWDLVREHDALKIISLNYDR